MERPEFTDIKSGAEFKRWYWLKKELVEICRQCNLPVNGRKFELQDRIIFALDNNGKVQSNPKPKKATSKFNWAKAKLTLHTIITDNISFDPNFRGFMKQQIGNKFSCHSDFMDWMKANIGKTLDDAVAAWHELELRKTDPEFRRKIAANNMFNQYTRDFMDDNPNTTIKDARKYWLLKKQLPTKDGFVRYKPTDLQLDSNVR